MTRPTAADVQAAFCSVLVDEWARAGVTHAVVAPGSRSTPLVLALDADPRVRVHVVLDERSAGFVALGLSLANRTPAVVATTSGTASVELHPAVVEAYHARVPLIAATADRPPELHDVGAPQTIDQTGLFGPSVGWATSPGVADIAAAGNWRSLASRCVGESLAEGGRPVHLNVALREPLMGDAGAVKTPPGRPGGAPWHQVAEAGREAGAPADLVALLGRHAKGRGLVVAGGGSGDPEALVAAAESLGWPVMADPRSSCRLPRMNVVAASDALLRIPSVAAWQPEVVVRAGSLPSSKVLNQWLASLPGDVPQVLADPSGRWADPDRTASHAVRLDAARLLGEVARGAKGSGATDGSSGWSARWFEAERAAQAALDKRLGADGSDGLSEPAVARAVVAGLPDGAALLVSSSMPVRDVEWFSAPRSGLRVMSNRGANGIDGVLSTAIGLALSGPPTCALVGDLAFLYDAGVLLGAREREIALTVMVVDNDGGGIFSFLPQASALGGSRFERYWGTPHGADVCAIAGAYGAEVREIDSRGSLDSLIGEASKPGVRVGVVRSDRAANVAVHEELNREVARAVAESGL
jgi:2-succinyl-5-enolpyruvyl-6-hydroxy-3-cyclohexene-1-carboxylate synthase